MMVPEYYIDDLKDKSVQELVIIRNKLIESLKCYENRKILNDNKEILREDMVKPSASTIYYWNNHQLKEITDLIIDKLKNRGEK